jgi:hypothetical protein
MFPQQVFERKAVQETNRFYGTAKLKNSSTRTLLTFTLYNLRRVDVRFLGEDAACNLLSADAMQSCSRLHGVPTTEDENLNIYLCFSVFVDPLYILDVVANIKIPVVTEKVITPLTESL